ALRFSDAVRLVRKRGEFMQDAVPVGTGAMAAIMGLELGAVEEVCAEAARGEVVEIANVNSTLQIVIGGHRAAVERAVALAARRARELDEAAVVDPVVPVVRNVDAGVTRTAAEVRPFLLRQVASPVRWTDCVRRLAAEGATAFVEVGPGRVLTGLLRRIITGAEGMSIEDPEGLERALAVVGGAGALPSEASL